MERTPEFASLAGKPLHFEAHRQQFMGDHGDNGHINQFDFIGLDVLAFCSQFTFSGATASKLIISVQSGLM